MTESRVTALALTPLKGARLLEVEEIELTERGASGDRRFFVIDELGRMLNGKVLGALQGVVAQLSGERFSLTFPDGRVVSGELPQSGEPLTAKFFSRELTGESIDGPWANALSDFLGRDLRLVRTGSAVDRGTKGAVSLVSQASLGRLTEEAGVESVDARRFRMLIEIDGIPAHAEDDWVGAEVTVGETTLRFNGHIGRCLVTSRDPETGEVTLPTLDLLRSYRGETDATEPLPFGIYGSVLRGGAVRVGDSVRLR